jgi:hypothetical protein
VPKEVSMTAARSLAALALLPLLTAAAPALRGTYHADCAPYDGPAFRVTMPAPGRGRPQYELAVNVPLAELAGQWTHTLDTRPGSATILLCRTVPETLCDYPRSGRFILSGKPGTTISGTFEATFTNGMRHSRRFTARPARQARQLLCG